MREDKQIIKVGFPWILSEVSQDFETEFRIIITSQDLELPSRVRILSQNLEAVFFVCEQGETVEVLELLNYISSKYVYIITSTSK